MLELGICVLTHKNRFREVVFVNSRDLSVDEVVYRVVASQGSYCFDVTGNHPVLVSDNRWVKVAELKNGDRLTLSRPQESDLFAVEDCKQINLMDLVPDCIKYYKSDSDSYVTYRGLDRRNTVTIPRSLPIDSNFLQVLGIYIAEGSVHAKSEISFATHVRETHERQLLENYFLQFGIHVNHHKSCENGMATRLSSVIFKGVFEKLCGKGASNKQLPNLGFSKIQVATMIKQYIQGDGHVRQVGHHQICIPTTSLRLAEQLRTIFSCWGIPIARTERNYKKKVHLHKNPKATPSSWNTLYILHASGKKLRALQSCLDGNFDIAEFDFTIPIKSIYPIDYCSKVYNLQVKEDETYTANGWIVHNCHYCNKGDSFYQRLMLMVQTQNTLEEINRRIVEEGMQDFFELQDQNLWQKTEYELNEKWLSDYSDVIDYDLFTQAKLNTVDICRRAKGVKLDRSIKLPQIADADDKLHEFVMQGAIARGIRGPEYIKRLKEEYNLIRHKQFSSYFLIQKQMTDEARRISPLLLGWGDGSEAVGPGRGCLAPYTPIISNGLCKPISEVIVGDLVVTNDGSSRMVEAIVKYPCDEEMVCIRTYYGDSRGVTLTKDHMVLSEKMVRPAAYSRWF